MRIDSLVLASTSRFRLGLLVEAGIVAEGMAPRCHEEGIVGASPRETARLRSEAKALSLGPTSGNHIIIAADQVLEFEGNAHGKASDRAEAGRSLRAFAGREHELHSAFTLALSSATGDAPRLLVSRVVTARLKMRPLSDLEIEAYLSTGEWEGAAGCYQYEKRGSQLFESVQGDHTTIIGLPILALLAELRARGINTLVQSRGPWENCHL